MKAHAILLECFLYLSQLEKFHTVLQDAVRSIPLVLEISWWCCIWDLASCFSSDLMVFKLQLPKIGQGRAELSNIQNRPEVYFTYLSLLLFLYCVIKKLFSMTQSYNWQMLCCKQKIQQISLIEALRHQLYHCKVEYFF